MHKQKLKDFDYYFQRNQFQRGSKQLIRNFKKARFADQGEKLIDGIRLLLIAKGPVFALSLLKRHHKKILRSGPCARLRMYYLQAEIAWQRGQSSEAYRRLLYIREQLKAEAGSQADRSVVCKKFCEQLLADIDILTGKCLTHENDHAMARIYFGRSYDHLHWKDEHTPHFMDGQIRMLFARSYFDWRKMPSIDGLLEKAEKKYGIPQEISTGRKGVHFHLAEVYTLQARYLVIKGLRKTSLKTSAEARKIERETLKRKVEAKLQAAEKIILHIFDRNHRCYAHILRLQSYFHLEFTKASIRENGGVISGEDYQQLCQVEQCYRRETFIRERFFGTQAHPSIARAYGLMTKTKLLQATYWGQQKNAASLQQALFEAEEYIRLSVRSNHKAGEEQKMLFHPLAEEAAFSQQHPALIKQRSDSQALQAKKYALEILTTKYNFANLLQLNKSVLFETVKNDFRSCQEILTANLNWVTSPDSKESVFDTFEPVQELFIEVCFEEYERGGSKDEQIVEIALDAMHQGRPNEEVNKPFEKNDFLNGHKKKLRLLQTFVNRRLNEEGDLEKFAQGEEVRQQYEQMTSEVFEEHQEYVRQYHTLTAYNEQKEQKIKRGGFSFEAIYSGFTGDYPGVAIALHFGSKHVYSIAIQDERKKDCQRASFIRLTDKEAPFRGVMELKRLAKSFNKVVRQLCDEQYWKKNSLARNGTDFSKEEIKAIENKILFTDHFVYDPDSKALADRLNSRFLLYGFRLYKLVFSKLSFGAKDRVYIGINRYRWQRIPLRAIFTEDPEIRFKNNKTVRFSENVENFIGTRQQVSVLPSIFELWRWGVTSGKKRQKKDFPNDKFYALAGGSDEEYNKDFQTTSEVSTYSITNTFKEAYQRITKLDYTPRVNKTVLNDTTKWEVITEFEDSAFIYAFLHTAKEYNEDGRRKIVLYASTPPKEIKEPSFLATFIWDEHCLYQEELANCQLDNVRLIFINSCLSADGRGSFGYVPYSTLSAVYAAGCHVVIGTQVKTYGTPMRTFANYLYNFWMNEEAIKDGISPQNLSVGDAIMYSSVAMAKDVGEGATHPLHWGSYVQIGDMTTKFEDCIKN